MGGYRRRRSGRRKRMFTTGHSGVRLEEAATLSRKVGTIILRLYAYFTGT